MFRATCRKSRQVEGTHQIIECNETFVGTEDIARYTEHMTKLHGLSLGRNTGIHTPGWLSAKPYSFKAPKSGSLPPKGKRRDAFLAAMDNEPQEEAAA